MIRRRLLWALALGLGLGFCLPSGLAKPRKKYKIKRYHLSMRHVNTKERFDNLWVIRVDPKNKNKQWVGNRAHKRLNHFLRDWRTGKSKRIPKRLLWNLYLVGQRFDAPIEVVSAYRHKERKSSRHKQGKAVDFRVVGVSNREVWNYCKRFDNVGLGLYPNSNFVHMDVRDRSYYWIDDSGPGEESEYRDGVTQRKQKKRRRKKAKSRKKKPKKTARRSAKKKGAKKAPTPEKKAPEKKTAPEKKADSAPKAPAEPAAPAPPAAPEKPVAPAAP